MSMKCERRRLQNDIEFNQFLKLARSEKVASYLEIGCKHGGTVWGMAQVLPPGSCIVAVDLPHGDFSFKETLPSLQECIRALRARGHKAHLFIGDSTDPKIVAQVKELGPFDLCFIDANHTEPFVRADWAIYGSLARIVAFHDISHVQRPDATSKKLPIHVPQVWQEIKQGYRNQEIRSPTSPRDNGIGILWRT